MTLEKLIKETERRLKAARLHYGHGTDHPRDEAAFLVLRGLGLPFSADLSRPADPGRVETLVRKRIEERIPAAYLLNEAWLDGVPFYVDRRVIIPRSHIAFLLKDLKVKPRRILDLCTGSGCLAILAARAFPEAEIDASDISRAGLSVAGRNVRTHKLDERIRLVHSDLFAKLKERYDLVMCNPPYVTTPSMRKLPREYRYEPGLALAGGSKGLDYVKRIIDAVPTRVTADGLLVCEIGENRKALRHAYPDTPFRWPQEEVFILERARMLAASGNAPTQS